MYDDKYAAHEDNIYERLSCPGPSVTAKAVTLDGGDVAVSQVQLLRR